MASMIEITVHVPRSDQAHEFLLPRDCAARFQNGLIRAGRFLAVARRQNGAATCPASTRRSCQEMR